jgi:hypothetical protein
MSQLQSAETSAGPLGLIIIIGVVVVLVFTFWRSMRHRASAARVRSGPLFGGSTTARAPGSAATIADGGQVPAQELRGALGVRGETDQDADAEDAGTGAMLGLCYHRFRHNGSGLWDPTVYDGTRNGHQVFIRLGRNAAVRGPGINARRLRHLSAVRVAVSPFELVAADGRLKPKTPVPPAVDALLAQLAPSPDVWRDLRVVAGPAGLVASRAYAQDWVSGWIYDLWLLERLAAVLHGAPLPPEALGREWTPPYGMGDWAPSIGAALSGT